MAGEILRDKREALHLNVGDIADRLKIREDYLSAIENDLFERLPAHVYTIGYIRSYAAYLDIDSEGIVQFYQGHLSQPKHTTIIPVAHFRKRSSPAVYILAVLLVAGVFYFARPHLLPMPTVTMATEQGKGSIVKAAPVQHSQQPASVQTVQTQKEGEHMLSITAIDKTWISISFYDGKKEEIMLLPGEIKSWKFPQTASLRIGNAGGITLHFDGKDMGSPGQAGQVISLSLPNDQKISG